MRSYSAPIVITTAFTASIDVFELLAATGKPVELIAFEFGQTSEVGDAQEEQLPLKLVRLSGSFTSGSGGGTSTFRRTASTNDTAPDVTLETGNTTQAAAGSGTANEVADFVWNVRTSCLYVPVPEERFVLLPGEALALQMISAPVDSISAIRGRIVVRELV